MESAIENSFSNSAELQNLDFLGKRIEVQGFIGTVKFAGTLQHLENPSDADKFQKWLGIEWDDVTRGKHNGTVNNFKYFTCTNNEPRGSLLKIEKINFGVNIFKAIVSKYFREDPKLMSYDQLLEIDKFMDLSNKENAKILIEYDDEAYVETLKKNKKRVEFVGFDRIWKKINNLKEIVEYSFCGQKIAEIGDFSLLGKLLPKLKVFSLENNLFYDWNQIYQLGAELPNLESLSLSGNVLREPSDFIKKEQILCLENKSIINKKPCEVFINLKTIIMLNMNLTWSALSKIIPTLPNIEELIVCRNRLSDFENIKFTNKDLQKLQFLNLEENQINSFEGLKVFGELPNLLKLILNKNFIGKIGKIDNFGKLEVLSFEENVIDDPKFLTELTQFKNLQNLRVKKNPFVEKYTNCYIRQRAVAENKKIKIINGSELKKYDRKDCEIYYLRKTFDDYFKLVQIYNKNKVLTAVAGKMLGKPSMKKKFPETTNILYMKQLCSKLFGIENKKILLNYKVDPHDPMELLEEEDKTLADFGLQNMTEIFVDEKN